MYYKDEELLPISSLMHYRFCSRRCALIHLDGIWTENRLTAEGRALHERVDSSVHESRGDICVAATLRLVSHKLGVAGIADMVEFHRTSDDDPNGAKLAGKRGRWIPFPVEYKHGKPNGRQADEVQLCAQAMCLEEMLGVTVPCGALFYGKTRHRLDVNFDAALRTLTENAARGVHELFSMGKVPRAEYGKWCEACSLLDDCYPQKQGLSVEKWLARQIEEVNV